MQAIITKYHGATSRISAKCERGKIYVPYPHEMIGEDCHIYAAKRLIANFTAEDAKKYGSEPESNPWNQPFVTGSLPSGEYVHVFTA